MYNRNLVILLGNLTPASKKCKIQNLYWDFSPSSCKGKWNDSTSFQYTNISKKNQSIRGSLLILRHFQVMEKLFVKYDCSLSVFKHHDVWLWNVFHYTEIGSTQQFICRFQKSESRTQTSKKAWKSTIINQNTKYFRFLQSTKRWY